MSIRSLALPATSLLAVALAATSVAEPVTQRDRGEQHSDRGHGQSQGHGYGRGDAGQPGVTRTTGDFRLDETGILQNHVQLTTAAEYFRAGEAYFSPDMKRMIFQAVRAPKDGAAPEEFYAMFLADLRYEGDRLVGLDHVRELSPPGSANTCGWFDPNDANVVYFGSTIEGPTQDDAPGYDRNSGRYKWMFPPEMRVVRCDLTRDHGDDGYLTVIEGDRDAYQAEDALSPDGRHMIYCSLSSGGGDLFVRDLTNGRVTPLVTAPGYDGGPFFSPDGTRICYRSDRAYNHLLQVFVADLAFDADGAITGIEREYQLTVNRHVNWGPYWHPNGRFIVYSTSEVGHHNYEVFIIDADPGTLPGSKGPVRYGTRARRVTHASGADVLPVFSPDGKRLLWTCQRAEDGKSQVWVADFVMPIEDEF